MFYGKHLIGGGGFGRNPGEGIIEKYIRILIDTVPNAGHFLMFENLDGFVEVITKFINKGKT